MNAVRRGAGMRAGAPAISLPATLALLALVGCAPRGAIPPRPMPETLPAESPLRSHGLRDSDAWLRHHLMFGEHPRAAEVVRGRSALAPRDRLVRALQEAVILHQAGEHARSNEILEWAEAEADRRYTRSVSRAAASLLINDGVMAYSPPAAELVMVPYYRMLNYLALRDRDAALVEARKANALLARLDRDPRERCREDGMLLYLAGLVQRSGGEMNDALVSLRQAERSFASCEARSEARERTVAADLYRVARSLGVQEIADSVAARYRLDAPDLPQAGDLLLLLEHGFVAHRAEEALHVPILPEEVEGLESEDSEGIAAAAARIASRLRRNAWQRGTWGQAWDDQPAAQWASALQGAYILRLAWPTLRLEAARPAGVRVWVDDSLAVVAPASDLSAVMHDEIQERRAAMLTRLVARGVAKYLVSREMEKKSEKKGGEVAAFVVGRLANLAANRLEQADLRSWSLLPDRISLARMRLPEGVHRVRIETLASNGAVATTQDLGEVTVRAGELVVINRRIWGGEAGELPLWEMPASFAADSGLADTHQGSLRPATERSGETRADGRVRTRSCPDGAEADGCGGVMPERGTAGSGATARPARETTRPRARPVGTGHRRPADGEAPRRARPRPPAGDTR